MQRTLIDYDVLKRITNDSLSSAEAELVLAEDVIASALGTDIVDIHCFSADDVIYETADGTFIHASYTIGPNNVIFEKIEELVVDEETEKKGAREVLTKMVEQLLDGKEEEAGQSFSEYVTLPIIKRTMNEGRFDIQKTAPTKHGKLWHKKQSRSLVRKRTLSRKRSLAKRSRSDKLRAKRERTRVKRSLPKRRGARAIVRWRKGMASECINLCENVFDFIDIKELGPTINESVAKYDDNGNIIALLVPNSRVRNEGQLLSFNWKTLDHKCKNCREGSKNLAENSEFCKAIAELKRHNGMSDSEALEESLEKIVTQWPDVLYLTQNELAQVVGNALNTSGIRSFDDAVCNFLAEGILRKAHSAYTERVESILKWSGSDAKAEEYEDDYDKFQKVVSDFYPTLDESVVGEMQVFVDLYNAVRTVHAEAVQQEAEEIVQEAEGHLRDLLAVVTKEEKPDLELAEEIAEWLYVLIETNLETKAWDVSNTPHMTVSGDHPAMAQKAKHPFSPASDSTGDWGDVAPVSDGKNYKGGLAAKMRSQSYGNVGGSDTYPALQNPYIPGASDFTMKGEPGVDKDSGGLVFRRGQTWPELQNPYTPDAIGPDGWRMKSDNLLIDK